MASSISQRLDALEKENRKQRGINAGLKASIRRLEPKELPEQEAEVGEALPPVESTEDK